MGQRTKQDAAVSIDVMLELMRKFEQHFCKTCEDPMVQLRVVQAACFCLYSFCVGLRETVAPLPRVRIGSGENLAALDFGFLNVGLQSFSSRSLWPSTLLTKAVATLWSYAPCCYYRHNNSHRTGRFSLFLFSHPPALLFGGESVFYSVSHPGGVGGETGNRTLRTGDRLTLFRQGLDLL